MVFFFLRSMNWSFISYYNQLQVLKGLIDFHFSLEHYPLFHVKLCYFNPVQPLQYTDELFCSKYAKATGKFRWKIVRPFSALLLSINLGIMFSEDPFSSWPYEFMNVQNVGFKRCHNKRGYNSGQFIPYMSHVWIQHRWKFHGGGWEEEIH